MPSAARFPAALEAQTRNHTGKSIPRNAAQTSQVTALSVCQPRLCQHSPGRKCLFGRQGCLAREENACWPSDRRNQKKRKRSRLTRSPEAPHTPSPAKGRKASQPPSRNDKDIRLLLGIRRRSRLSPRALGPRPTRRSSPPLGQTNPFRRQSGLPGARREGCPPIAGSRQLSAI